MLRTSGAACVPGHGFPPLFLGASSYSRAAHGASEHYEPMSLAEIRRVLLQNFVMDLGAYPFARMPNGAEEVLFKVARVSMDDLPEAGDTGVAAPHAQSLETCPEAISGRPSALLRGLPAAVDARTPCRKPRPAPSITAGSRGSGRVCRTPARSTPRGSPSSRGRKRQLGFRVPTVA